MASPVYFFPRVVKSAVVENNRLRQSFLAERGVAAAFAGVLDVSRQTTCYDLPGKGPGGHSGLILQVLGDPAPVRIGFTGEHQRWTERPAGCDCWVGIDTEYPPTPAELAIGAPRGYPLTLGDGQTWKVPIVRSLQPERSQLPFDFVYTETGEASMERGESPLWTLAGEAWNHTFHREQYPLISTEMLLDLCLGALGLNYRVGKVEQTLLRLINSTNWSQCVEFILDVPMMRDYVESQKKTDSPLPESPSASPGAEG